LSKTTLRFRQWFLRRNLERLRKRTVYKDFNEPSHEFIIVRDELRLDADCPSAFQELSNRIVIFYRTPQECRRSNVSMKVECVDVIYPSDAVGSRKITEESAEIVGHKQFLNGLEERSVCHAAV